MIYKRLGRTGLEISRLSFGAMRFPYKDGKPDREETIKMIRRSFELGVNFIDSAIMYCDGESEKIVGEALKGWRDKVYVSTKNHHRVSDEKVWWSHLENSLKYLDVDYIDVYNLHGTNWKDFEKWGKLIVSWMNKAKDQGLIKHVCCSFHDNAEGLRKVAATDAFSSIILQYNYLDRELESAFEEVAARDIGIIVMGPVGGGQLAEDSAALKQIVTGKDSLATMALRYVLSNPYVTAAISGMSTMEQVEENCAVGGRSEPLAEAEKDNIHTVLDKLKGLADLYCTGCRYCLPCPSNVDIPGIFKVVNRAKVYDMMNAAKMYYGWIQGKAGFCIACGACEPKCPQKIPIRRQMVEAAKMFEETFGTMGLNIDPLGRTDKGVEIRARIHNINDQPGKASISLSEENGSQVEPKTIDVEIDKPLVEKDKTILVVPSDGAGQVVIKAEIEDGKGKRTESFVCRMGQCLKVKSLDELCRFGCAAIPATVDKEDQVFDGKDRLNKPYGVEILPGYTNEDLLFRIKIKDIDDSATSKVSDVGLDLFLDFRPRNGRLGIGQQDGMFWCRISAKKNEPAKTETKRGQLDAEKVKAERVNDPKSTEVRISIPLSAFGDVKPEPGRAFGFDLGVELWDFKGEKAFHAVWSTYRWSVYTGRAGTLFFG